MQVQVINKPLKYGRCNYQIGDRIQMDRKHARLFMVIGRVRFPEAPRADIPASPSLPLRIVEGKEERYVNTIAQEMAMAPDPEPEAETAEKSGDYETENMEAEEISSRTGRPKLTYRRRDMQAEGAKNGD
jgi:hypothetical protein